MELIVDLGESLFLSRTYLLLPLPLQAYLPLHSLLRDSITLWIMATTGALILYFSIATLIYYTYFDRDLMKHPKMLPNQIGKEMKVNCYVS
jgi:lathosterol oxidase